MIKKIGKFEIIRELGRGAMGRVYAARDEEKRVCALKVLNRGKVLSGKLLARFEREAHLLQSLDHPNIIKLYEVGESDGLSYFSMEIAKGKELAHIIPKGGMDYEQALYVIQRIALACEHAHSRGIVHRDLKPQNVIVDGFGNPHVMDFGIAKNLEEDQDNALTKTGALLGTPAYMSPEQAEGKTHEIDHLADVYALGSTLYCMLAGHPPFQGGNSSQILMKVIQEDPIPLQQIRPDIPAEVAMICHRAMSKLKRERYKTANDFALDIERFFRGRDVIATERTMFERFLGVIVTHKKISMLSFLSVLILVAGSLFLNRDVNNSNKRIDEQFKIYQKEITGYIGKGNFLAAEESANRLSLLNEIWIGISSSGNEILDKQFGKISTGKRNYYRNLIQQGKGSYLNSNKSSEKLAEAYVANPSLLTEEGKIYFCYNKWWTEREAKERGFLINQGGKWIHEPNKFSFKKFPNAIFDVKQIQKKGLAYFYNGSWLTPKEAEREGFFFVKSQGKWLSGEEAEKEGRLYLEKSTGRYYSEQEANQRGIFFDANFTRKWYSKEEAQLRGLTLQEGDRWLTMEEANEKGNIFVRTKNYQGVWKNRDELWRGGIDKDIIHDDINQKFSCIKNIRSLNWILGYDEIGQIKVWDAKDPDNPRDLYNIFGVPRQVKTLAYDRDNGSIIVPAPEGIFGFSASGDKLLKNTSLRYDKTVSSVFDLQKDLLLALLYPEKLAILKFKKLPRAKKPFTRYVCKVPERYQGKEGYDFTHASLSDDARSIVAVTKNHEFFIFYMDKVINANDDIIGVPKKLLDFKRTNKDRKIAAIATINSKFLAVSFETAPFEVEIWNIERGFKRKILAGHNAKVVSISFGINSESILTCSEDGKIILWRIKKN